MFKLQAITSEIVTMRIDSQLPSTANLEPVRPGNASSTSHQSGPKNQTEDNASLSMDQEAVHSLESEVACCPEIRKGRVEALRAAITGGNFEIDPPKIAAVLMAEMFR